MIEVCQIRQTSLLSILTKLNFVVEKFSHLSVVFCRNRRNGQNRQKRQTFSVTYFPSDSWNPYQLSIRITNFLWITIKIDWDLIKTRSKNLIITIITMNTLICFFFNQTSFQLLIISIRPTLHTNMRWTSTMATALIYHRAKNYFYNDT